MSTVPLFSQQQQLLGSLSSAVADGFADTRRCTHIDVAFSTFLGGKYVGIKFCFEGKQCRALALFQHEQDACGPMFIREALPSTITTAALLTMRAEGGQALLRVPVLYTDAGIHCMVGKEGDMQKMFHAWSELCSSVPVIGSLLVAVPALPERNTTMLDVYIINALMLGSVLGNDILQRAHGRLLKAAMAAGVIPCHATSMIKYIPGKVICGDGVGGHDDAARLLGHSNVDTALMHLLQGGLGDGVINSQHSVNGPSCSDDDADDGVCESSGEEQGEEQLVVAEQQYGSCDDEQTGSSIDDNDDEISQMKHVSNVRKRRCSDDDNVRSRKPRGEDDDDAEGSGGGHHHRESPAGGSVCSIAAAGNNNNVGEQHTPAHEGGTHKQSCSSSFKTAHQPSATILARHADGLRYRDAHTEGLFEVYMQSRMPLIIKALILCVMIGVTVKSYQLMHTHEGSVTQCIGLLSLIHAAAAWVMWSVPCGTRAWLARAKELLMTTVFLALAVPSMLLHARYWMDVASGTRAVNKPMLLMTFVAVFGNGGLVQSIRYTWVLPLGMLKVAALLGCTAWTMWQEPIVPWWNGVATVFVAWMLAGATRRTRALEVAMRKSFEQQVHLA